jgi:cytochrome c-type biogenesis protein
MSEASTSSDVRPGSRRRARLAVVTTLLVLSVAVTAGLLLSSDGGTPVIFVERISSEIGGLTSGAGGTIWWVYAFLLGVVAAFNPCGFALLPAYLALYLNDEQAGDGLTARTKRSIKVSIVVAGSFTVLFGVTGVLFSLASTFIVRLLPWVGLGVGIVLIVVGGMTMGGSPIRFDTAQQVAGKFGRGASASSTRGYAAFGLAYGLASLGCALPLFLALVGTAVALGGVGSAILAFALYGAGMAATLGMLTVLAGIVSFGILSRVRSVARVVSSVGSVLLLVSGAYVVYYWLTAGRLLFA